MSGGDQGTFRLARRRCVVGWASLFLREAVSMQRLRLAARLVNASPSLEGRAVLRH